MTTSRSERTQGAAAGGPPSPEQVRAGWDAIAVGFDAFATPLNMALGEEALRRVPLRRGTTFLDVAAGSGALALPAARRGARVTATDFSGAMVERLQARARAEGLTEVEARVMDGTALAFEDGAFDVSGSQFGVMLFPDLGAGLREMARVTRPGGHVLMVAFGPIERAEFLGFFVGALRSTVPGFTGPPLDPPPLPFQVSDPEVLRGAMGAAGLTDVRIEASVHAMTFASGEEMWNMIVHSNPIGAAMVADLDDAQRRAAQAELDAALARRAQALGLDRAVLDNAVHIAVGLAP